MEATRTCNTVFRIFFNTCICFSLSGIRYTLDPLLAGPYVDIAFTTTTNWTVANAQLGTVYTFRVIPLNTAGEGGGVYGRYIPAVAPDPIGNITVTDVSDISMRVVSYQFNIFLDF